VIEYDDPRLAYMFELVAPGKYMEPSLYRSAKGDWVTAVTTLIVGFPETPPELSTIAYDPGFWFVGFTCVALAKIIASDGREWPRSESKDWT